MEVIGTDDDFGLFGGDSLDGVAPFSDCFDGSFDGFHAGVHGERHVESGEVVELFEEQGKLVVAEGARGEGNFVNLLCEGFEDCGVAVSLIDC